MHINVLSVALLIWNDVFDRILELLKQEVSAFNERKTKHTRI